ncbi:PRD domain-containing protein [Vagococcus sp. DIV0080]|uniref:PRD domain-containing protein n=1 Tax=Candidatus Vagococcus giribetii TaxID=2230876 RepID=A0ABS3HQG8_9ENTE|nr:PRD domain-containing protein [Vagococcus sp. DIV0080]MBO0475992.1 PRD domain-containing protein [Vagococcus sp. DIV0080]
MRIIKKINNNVAECVDAKGNHLIAFGNGIGFPKTPYELEDLSKINMTFYKLDKYFELLLTEVPEDIFNISMEIVREANKELKGTLNTTLVFNLADHINFSIQRLQKNKKTPLNYSYEIAKMHPEETELAKKSIKLIEEKKNISLPEGEITSLTMHFVNSRLEYKETQEEILIKELINKITELIELEFGIIIDKTEFHYNRFCNHLVYFLKRLQNEKSITSKNGSLLDHLKKQHSEVFLVTNQVKELVYQYFNKYVEDDELVYLIIHINRLYENNV